MVLRQTLKLMSVLSCALVYTEHENELTVRQENAKWFLEKYTKFYYWESYAETTEWQFSPLESFITHSFLFSLWYQWMFPVWWENPYSHQHLLPYLRCKHFSQMEIIDNISIVRYSNVAEVCLIVVALLEWVWFHPGKMILTSNWIYSILWFSQPNFHYRFL